MDRLSVDKKSSSTDSKVSVISEKSLKDWKLPAFSASDIYNKRSSFFSTIRTVEKEIRLSESYASFPLFSKSFARFYQKFFCLLHVGMIQVALKPTKLGSNTSAVICVCDKRMEDERSVLGRLESSLGDGPIYFLYFPSHFISTTDAHCTFAIDIKIKGCKTLPRGESVVLMYRFHYKLVDSPLLDLKYLYVSQTLAKAVQRNSPSEDEEEGAAADARVDWKETAEVHVLQVDVPGLKKEEVNIEVEDGSTLVISGERSKEQEENQHCVERSSGRFLRRVTLPENAKLEQVKAAMENGVLTVTVPKEKVKKKTEVKVIAISG